MMLTMTGKEGTFKPGAFGSMVDGAGRMDRRAGFAGGERLAKLTVAAERAMGVDSTDKAADVLRLAGMDAWGREDGVVGLRHGLKARWRVGGGWQLMAGERVEFDPAARETLSEVLAARWYGLSRADGLEVQRMLQRIAGTEVGP